MVLKTGEYVINASFDEILIIAFEIKNGIERSLKSYHAKNQKGWVSREKERLSICKFLFGIVGASHFYDDIFDVATDIFEDYNFKQKSNEEKTENI